MVDAVTPRAGLVSQVAQANTPVNVAVGGDNGGFIVNPATGGDQGLPGDPETLYVDPVGPATLQGNGTTFAIPPGGSWQFIAGQTTPTSVNAPTGGHKFSVVRF